jgi:hypothetical protein
MVTKVKPLQSGQMRHLGNLEKRVAGQDATGAPSVAYELVAAGVQFAVDDWKPTENYAAAAVQGNLSTRLIIRWRPGMEGNAPNTMRMVHLTNPGHSPAIFEYYDILGAVRDPDMRVQLTLTCVRRDGDGFRTGATP